MFRRRFSPLLKRADPNAPPPRARPTSVMWSSSGYMADFMRKVHAKNAEWMLIVPGMIIAPIVVFKSDIFFPAYSNVVAGPDMYGNNPDPIDTYRLEPITDKDGKIVAMRKIKNRPASSSAESINA